jgi:hypothetical protein
VAIVIEGKVASRLDATLIAFNKGANDGVKIKNKIVLWRTADLFDPDTDLPLGKLKMEALSLSVVHVQETLCVAEITSEAESDGRLSGMVLGAWEKKKRATSDSDAADGRNLILVRSGDEATIYISGSPALSEK